MRIAVDAMGGDYAPNEIVKGAVQSAQKLKDVEIILVGDEKRVNSELSSIGDCPKNIRVHHASQVVGMDEPATTALRQKIDSSITKSVKLVANGEADAVVSAGHTGATVAACSMFLRSLKGVKRPGIAAAVPTHAGICTIIDVGANIKCKPDHLLQYARMASIVCKYTLKVEEPRVGLLNIGEEDVKGNELVKETFELLSHAPINFVGNVEGRDIFGGKLDVAVCDGFVGNILIKTIEGLSQSILKAFKTEASKTLLTRLGMSLCMPVWEGLWNKNDYTEYGGVLLLGVDGICIISHGSSDSKAIRSAIKETVQLGMHQVNKHIVSELETKASYVASA
ncbi:MAG TPA: phosphate acyltransferase PlsX [Candidatus Brocadiia bacterium]|nr:phosphate acyltransferase PlsX [Planctomycetota bacterium]MDO8091997.1 phosphate acyltransferase PlsX [Candidatus Brocadiales bacterium]